MSSDWFLISNDDGIDAPGLGALCAAVVDMAEVRVVAPAGARSAAGHSVTDRRPILAQVSATPGGHPGWAVDGSPADCVRVGLGPLARGDGPPAWVLSGINVGANLGVDTYYSGTVAAAREALLHGCRAVAVSQYLTPDIGVDWSRSGRLARRILDWLFAAVPDPRPSLWNVNLPALAPNEGPKGLRIVPMDCLPVATKLDEDEAQATPGRRVFEFAGIYHVRRATAGSDVEAVLAGYATVTPLGLDKTDLPLLRALSSHPLPDLSAQD